MIPNETFREARTRYFAENGFGDDGGYGDAWVDFKLGPVPMPFPNTPARLRALRYHDLHHVVTGYTTSTIGEFEISAWELAAGCKDFAAAWILNLGGLAAGMLVAPVRTTRAFLRGRRDRTLYGEPYDALLDEPVSLGVARCVGVRTPSPAPSAARLVLFTLVGALVALTLMALVVPLVPLGLVNHARRRREIAAASPGAG